jgi:hypothetical protein
MTLAMRALGTNQRGLADVLGLSRLLRRRAGRYWPPASEIPPSSGPVYPAVHVPAQVPSPAMAIDHVPFTNAAVVPL